MTEQAKQLARNKAYTVSTPNLTDVVVYWNTSYYCSFPDVFVANGLSSERDYKC